MLKNSTRLKGPTQSTRICLVPARLGIEFCPITTNPAETASLEAEMSLAYVSGAGDIAFVPAHFTGGQMFPN